MFWNSVVAGIGQLSNYEIWVGVGIYILLNVGFLAVVLVGYLGGESVGTTSGCAFQLVRIPADIVLLGAFVILLLPSMWGEGGILPLGIVMDNLWPIAKASFLAFGVVLLIGFIPVVGQFISTAPGIQTFIMGVVIFRVIFGDLIKSIANLSGSEPDPYPGFLVSIGFLVVSGIFSVTLRFVVAGVGIGLDRAQEGAGTLVAMLVMSGVTLLSGVVPLLMYIQYVRLILSG